MPGRGRGRHLPINYPDGLACKSAPTQPYPRLDPEQLPVPLTMTVADKELLNLRRNLLSSASVKAFQVQGARSPRGLVRYSDRYLDAPVQHLDKSELLTLKRNVHVPEELLPPPKRWTKGRQQPAPGASEARPSSADRQTYFKRLKKSVSTLLDDMEREEDDSAAMSATAADTKQQSHEAAGDAAHDDDDDRKKESGAGDSDVDAQDSEEEDGDLYNDDDYGGFGSENDMDDDLDDGGDDEPTY